MNTGNRIKDYEGGRLLFAAALVGIVALGTHLVAFVAVWSTTFPRIPSSIFIIAWTVSFILFAIATFEAIGKLKSLTGHEEHSP